MSAMPIHLDIDDLLNIVNGGASQLPVSGLPAITQIWIYSPDRIHAVQGDMLLLTDARFSNVEQLRLEIEHLVLPLGHLFDYDHPSVSVRLPSGWHLEAAMPPVAPHGPIAIFRAFVRDLPSGQDLIDNGTLTSDALTFLSACVAASFNILISGGRGAGKTILLNLLAGIIPPHEQVISIENRRELPFPHDRRIRLETSLLADMAGGGLSVTDLAREALRASPSRLIIAELDGPEALDLLDAANTSHDGVMATLYARSPRHALARLENLCLMAAQRITPHAVREQITSGIHLIVHIDTLRDGSHKVTRIVEVYSLVGDAPPFVDIFAYQQTGFEEGRVIGNLKPTGLRPKNMGKIEEAGIKLPPSVFGVRPGKST